MFSSKSFIVSGLTFRSLIHLEFIVVYGVRECCLLVLFMDSFAVQEILSFFRSHFLFLFLFPLL